MLWDQLLRTERRADEMRRETQRLRQLKDEAKHLVAKKHPQLFEDEDVDDDSSLSEGHRNTLANDLREIKQMLAAGQQHRGQEDINTR